MASAPAFQIHAADHPALARTLRAKLEAEKTEKTAQLLFSQDWADFSRRRGVIEGLTLAITECVEAEKNGD